MERLWSYIKTKVSTGMIDEKVTVILSGMVDEKVTVILSVIHHVHTKAKMEVENWDQSERWKLRNNKSANFFVTEAGNALAALGNIHEGDSHILK